MVRYSEVQYEKNLIINGRTLTYKGIFREDELFSAINRALEERGYEKREKKTEEVVTEGGRKTYVELRPFKELSNYIVLQIKMKITLDNVTGKIEEVNGEKKKFQQGDVHIVFDAWELTDYQNRWGMKPLVYFVKGFIKKYVYAMPIEAGSKGVLSGDTAFIYGTIKKMLNAYKLEVGKGPKEEDIRRQMEEDVKREMESIERGE